LVSTSADLVRFMRSLFQGKIVSATSLREMLVAWPMEYPLENHRYGLGVQKFDSELGPASGHTGQFTGYRSVAFHFERSQITVAMQVNADAENLMPTFVKLAQFVHANGVAGYMACAY
jgi:D-alanyl-D-alanine carboxypeptidase